MKHSNTRTRTDDDDDNLNSPAVPRSGGKKQPPSQMIMTAPSTNSFPGYVPETSVAAAAPSLNVAAGARFQNQDDLVAEKKRASVPAAGSYDVRAHTRGLEEEKVEEQATIGGGNKEAAFAKKQDNFAPVLGSSVGQGSPNRFGNKKDPQERPPLIENITGPNMPRDNVDARNTPGSMTDMIGSAVTAQVVPEGEDLEAQFQSRMHQERQEIVSEVQRNIMSQAKHAEIVTPDDENETKANSSRSWKHWALLVGLVAVVIAVVVALVVVLVKDENPNPDQGDPIQQQPGPTNEDAICTLCADGLVPENLDTLTIGDDGDLCSEFNEAQMQLNATSDDCLQGQAEAWRYCNCPTLPPITEDATCTLCMNVSVALKNPQDNVANRACADWDTYMAIAVSDPSECSALRADLWDCKCASEPTLFQYLADIVRPVSGNSVLEEGTPQNMALKWLAENDTAGMSSETSDTVLLHRYVLAVLYFATGGPSSWEKEFGFLSSSDVCAWHDGDENGVTCLGSAINKLKLASNNLIGSLPKELSVLTDLKRIELPNNRISGIIPQDLGDLKALDFCDLHFNEITGEIPPSMFLIPTLRILWLDGNQLTGKLSDSIGNSVSLELLACDGCSLSGTIPDSISSLRSLLYLDLTANNFVGRLPSFSETADLQMLSLSHNQLTGTLPHSFGSLSRLKDLYLTNNTLTGTISRDLGNLPSLVNFDLNRNSLVGPIPPFTSELVSQVWLHGNNFTGTLDEFFNSSSSAALTKIRFEENRLLGTVPGTIGNFVLLDEISLATNRLSGTLPASLGNLLDVERLNLLENNFVGMLPSTLSNLTSMKFFSVRSNFLTGTIPPSLGSLPLLEKIDLGGNRLTGDLPPFASQHLEGVWMTSNRLSGNLDEFFNSTTSAALMKIVLTENQFSGSLPDSVGKFSKLDLFFLNENRLTGSLPATLGNLLNVETLRLQNVGVTGTIPTELGSLTKLNYLDLGSNDLSGTVPSELGNCLSLATLSLSFCGLGGAFPSHVVNLPDLETVYLHGNDFDNDFETTFCARPNHQFDLLSSDCLADTVDCTCCAYCCTDEGINCVPN